MPQYQQIFIKKNIVIQITILQFIAIFGLTAIVYLIINNSIPRERHYNKKIFDYLHALKYPEIRHLLISNQMSLSQYFHLNPFQLRMIQKCPIRQLIIWNILTAEHILGFRNMEQIYTLQYPTIHQALLEHEIDVNTIMRMTSSQMRALRNPDIWMLVHFHALTLEQFQQMGPTHLQFLNLPIIRELFLNGGINFNQIINYRLIEFIHLRNQHIFFAQNRQTQDQNPANKIIINHPQSTHNLSIHESTTKSAINLFKRYQKNLDVAENLVKLQNKIQGLPEDFINNAAKRCINRIIRPTYQFVDRQSKISIHTLLALVYCAIHDEYLLICSPTQAFELVIEGLYEIQRGKNISEQKVDDLDKKDKFICPGGVFNKLIEKLNVIHPDIEMVYISLSLASLKLPKVIQNLIKEFLNGLSNPSDCKSFLTFTQMIADLKHQGYSVVWPHIFFKLTELMFEEFHCLFENKNSAGFQQFIETGKDAPSIEYEQFQKNIFFSKGYQGFCSEILKQSKGFYIQKQQSHYQKVSDNPSTLKLKR